MELEIGNPPFRVAYCTFSYSIVVHNVLLTRKKIKWHKRLGGRSFDGCRISVDGTDVRICEPTPLSPKWYSHKFHGPGLRNEIGIAIETGYIVRAHGPFPSGKYSDARIFKLVLKTRLLPHKNVVADGGYTDERCRKTGSTPELTEFFSLVRARHQTANRRLKQFLVLSNRFRHKLALHLFCFHAIVNITQLIIESGEPLFHVSQ